MKLRLAISAAVVGALLVPSVADAVLYGRVAAPRVITLERADGTNVNHVRSGNKTFVIRDRGSNHNFHLRGPGVNMETGVAFVGRKKWRGVPLSNGTYEYLCDIFGHAQLVDVGPERVCIGMCGTVTVR
jgi:hypothetical protein